MNQPLGTGLTRYDGVLDLLSSLGGVAFEGRLLKADFNPSPTLDPATLVECDFPGYARHAWTVGFVANDGMDGVRVSTLNVANFNQSADAPAQLVYGWAIAKPGGNRLWAAQRFVNPLTMQKNGDRIVVQLPFLRFPPPVIGAVFLKWFPV
jgi:hypothetical protein